MSRLPVPRVPPGDRLYDTSDQMYCSRISAEATRNHETVGKASQWPKRPDNAHLIENLETRTIDEFSTPPCRWTSSRLWRNASSAGIKNVTKPFGGCKLIGWAMGDWRQIPAP